MNRTLNVLLVDDDHDDNFFHQRAIQRSGITAHVAVCQDGERALDHLRRADAGEHPVPDLIFLDINMPRINGWDFMAQFEQMQPALHRTPIILMLCTDDHKPGEQSALVREFLRKPLTRESFARVVQEYIERP